MFRVLRTDSNAKDFQDLVVLLDKDLAIKDGDEHSFFKQYNGSDLIKHVVLIYYEQIPVGCGALKEFDEETIEIKRMFVIDEKRGKGISNQVLKELEGWAKELGYKKLILETGVKMVEAIGLYKKNSYLQIENYAQYKGVKSSVCFEKLITD